METKNEITVKEIHEDFYSEQDRLLTKAVAGVNKSVDAAKQKAERLRKLGFTSSKPIEQAQTLESDKRDAEESKGAIEYFSRKYPMYRFITELSVKRLCEKYGFVYGPVRNYIGEIPDANIQQMENCMIADSDKAYQFFSMTGWGGRSNIIDYAEHKSLEITKVKKERETTGISQMERMLRTSIFDGMEGSQQLPLEIVAPANEFNLNGMMVQDNQVIPVPVVNHDPIVLQPVYFAGKKHYLIVTAWGLEASDPVVFNANHN